MTLDELVSEVYIRTKRPDLTSLTVSAVKAATLKAHQTDFYSKDIYETGLEFSTANYRQQIDIITLFSNFRSLKYIKRVTDESDTEGVFFSILTPENLLDAYGDSKVDVAYVAGRVIELRASVEFSKLLIGFYAYPLLTDISYSSWIAEQHPYYIINEASRVILKTIGHDEESAQYNLLVAEELALLRMSGLSDVGY